MNEVNDPQAALKEKFINNHSEVSHESQTPDTKITTHEVSNEVNTKEVTQNKRKYTHFDFNSPVRRIKFNYEDIKQEYISSRVLTLPEIMRRHNCSVSRYKYSCLLRKRDKWDKQRQDYFKKVDQKVMNKQVNEEFNLTNELGVLIRQHVKLLRLTETDAGLKTNNGLHIKDYDKTVSQLDTIVKLQRLLTDKSTDNVSLTERKQILQTLIKDYNSVGASDGKNRINNNDMADI